MNSAKRYLLIALSFAICMTVFSTWAPRIAHAVTATLVQVMNTNNNPVPTQGDGRNVVYLYYSETMADGTSSSTGTGAGNPLNDASTHNPFTVPAGKRLVIDSISSFSLPPSGQVSEYLFNGITFTAVPFVAQVPGNYVAAVPIRDYVEPNGQYLASMFRSSVSGGMFWSVYAVGHLVDCTNGGGC